MPLLTTNKWITGKITGFSFILLLALIVVLTFHFNVLKFQPHYHINFGGTGDLKYFSNNQFGPEFGVKNFSLWVRCQWTRPMGKGFSISLPQTFRGSTILITFYLLNLQKRALLLDVRNYKDEILGFLSVTPDKKFQEYQIEIKLGEMQRRLTKINVGNAENRQKVDKLQIEKLEIFSEKGSSLPWRYNFQFLLAIFFSFCLILVSGFRLNHAIISSIGMAIFFTAIRFIDVLVYLKYIKSFLLSFPFILLAVLLIRIFSKDIINTLFHGIHRAFHRPILSISFPLRRSTQDQLFPSIGKRRNRGVC
jgi:hypothetical protein